MCRRFTVSCHRLLGWSAFTGIFIVVLIWPLNNFVAKRSIRIQKGLSNSRDKRMGVLNELLGAVSTLSAPIAAGMGSTLR